MRYITIALAKGRLAKKAMEIFEQIGIPCEEMKDEKTRKLIFTNEELGFRFFLSKPSDVPTYVEEVFMKYMTFRWANAECVYVVLNQQEKSYSIMSL